MAVNRSVNKITLLGNLTRDAEVNFTASGTPVCSFTIATNRTWKNANGEFQEEASFHRVTVWGKFGESLGKFLVKGTKVYIEGSLSYREQRDPAGKFISRDARINADSVIVLSSKGGSSSEEEMEPVSTKGAAQDQDFDLDAIAKDMDEGKKVTAKGNAESPVDDDLPF